MTEAKDQMPSKSSIARSWANQSEEYVSSIFNPTVYDRMLNSSWANYECWACGSPSSKGKSLQRCHIKPKMLGGICDPLNLFLMCNSCHADSPDYMEEKYFHEYVKSKEYYLKRFFKAAEIVCSANHESLTPDVQRNAAEWFINNMDKMGQHKAKIVPSTFSAHLSNSINHAIESC